MALAGARWRPDEIDAALGQWAEGDFPLPVPRRRAHLSAREAFLHLVMFATLYVAAYNTGAILFTLIERRWPDRVVFNPSVDYDIEGLRWAIAGLLIGLPVFLYTQRLIGRAIALEPEQRASSVRRWLTYLTLFVAALVLIGDFVVVLRGFLSGELAPRVLLKSAVVALIAGAVFRYFLGGLRRDEAEVVQAATRGWLGPAGVAAMVVTAIVGLASVGTPRHARMSQGDQQRVRDLDQLSEAIVAYHDKSGMLPAVLDSLDRRPGPRSETMRRDRETRAAYGYTVVDARHYRLCATFATADSTGPGSGVDEFWRHPPGEHCFTFELPKRSP